MSFYFDLVIFINFALYFTQFRCGVATFDILSECHWLRPHIAGSVEPDQANTCEGKQEGLLFF